MPPTGSAAPVVAALVGHGYWGPNLLRNYMELPGATVRWVCDQRPEALQKAQMVHWGLAVLYHLQWSMNGLGRYN